jgi:hypothetical protein
MKQVKITINGTILAVDYCSQTLYNEDEDFNCNYYLICGWHTVEGMYIDTDTAENVVKKKGKYVKVRDYFHKLWGKDSYHPLPVECHTRHYQNCCVDYMIDLEDDKEFDIKKVQLIKSDYETSEFPYFILADKILYDGKEILTEDTADFCPEEKIYNDFVVEELCY